MGTGYEEVKWWHCAVSIMLGLWSGLVIGFVTEISRFEEAQWTHGEEHAKSTCRLEASTVHQAAPISINERSQDCNQSQGSLCFFSSSWPLLSMISSACRS